MLKKTILLKSIFLLVAFNLNTTNSPIMPIEILKEMLEYLPGNSSTLNTFVRKIPVNSQVYKEIAKSILEYEPIINPSQIDSFINSNYKTSKNIGLNKNIKKEAYKLLENNILNYTNKQFYNLLKCKSCIKKDWQACFDNYLNYTKQLKRNYKELKNKHTLNLLIQEKQENRFRDLKEYEEIEQKLTLFLAQLNKFKESIPTNNIQARDILEPLIVLSVLTMVFHTITLESIDAIELYVFRQFVFKIYSKIIRMLLINLYNAGAIISGIALFYVLPWLLIAYKSIIFAHRIADINFVIDELIDKHDTLSSSILNYQVLVKDLINLLKNRPYIAS